MRKLNIAEGEGLLPGTITVDEYLKRIKENQPSEEEVKILRPLMQKISGLTIKFFKDFKNLGWVREKQMPRGWKRPFGKPGTVGRLWGLDDSSAQGGTPKILRYLVISTGPLLQEKRFGNGKVLLILLMINLKKIGVQVLGRIQSLILRNNRINMLKI